MRINQVCTHFHNPFPLPVEPFGCQVSSPDSPSLSCLSSSSSDAKHARPTSTNASFSTRKRRKHGSGKRIFKYVSLLLSLYLHPCTFPSNNMFFPLAVRLQPLQPEKPHTPIWWWQWLTPHKPQRGRIWYDTFFRRTMLTRIGWGKSSMISAFHVPLKSIIDEQ